MQNKTPDYYNFDFDFEDDVHFESEVDAFETCLEALAGMLFNQLRSLKNGTLTEQEVSDMLDFIGPFGPGLRCFNAWCFVTTGRIDGDYDAFAKEIRSRCLASIKSGRAKYAGQERNRAKDTKTLDLFGFCHA